MKSSPIAAFKTSSLIVVMLMLLIGCGEKKEVIDLMGGSQAPGESLLAKSLVGYWSPRLDAAELDKMVAEALPAVGGIDPSDTEALQEVRDMITKSVTGFVIHFDGSKTVIYGEDAPENATYTVTSANAATGTLNLNIVAADGEIQPGTAVIKGEQLELAQGNEEMKLKLKRISQAEFDAMSAIKR